MGRVFGRIGGIAACGGVGAVSAWALVAAADWTGTAGAIAAVIVAMVVASASWVAGTVALRALKVTR
jgi:hypothetical protein